MIARLPLIVIGIPLVYLILIAGQWPRCILLAAVSYIGQWEFFVMMNRREVEFPQASGETRYRSFRYSLEYITGASLLVTTTLWGERGLLLGTAISVFFYAIAAVMRGLDGNGRMRFAVAIAGLLYLPFSMSFFQLLAAHSGPHIVFALLIVIWSLDIGAYIFGMTLRRFWKAQLAPEISPNKTIVGALGGTLACLIVVLALAKFQLLPLSGLRLWLFAFTIAIVGQIADLFESVLKRDAGLKDSSSLLGAHGGMLDRIDSLLFLGSTTYIFMII